MTERARRDAATSAAKVFLGVASVAGTLGGWAVLAAKEPAPTAPLPAAKAKVATVRAAAPARRARVKPATFTRSSR
jgi:hypothetical protein